MKRRLDCGQELRPVVCGLGLYFLVSGMDSFRIGNIGSLLKLVALLPLGLSLLDFQAWRLRLRVGLAAVVAFWFLAVISIFYSVNPEKSLGSVVSLSMNLALVIVLGSLEQYSAGEIRFLQKALLAGSWLTILLLFLFSDVSADGRLTLLLGEYDQDQNYINGYFLYAFSWHCARFLLAKRKIHALPAGLILSIVLLTGSRGALLGFLLVIFVQVCVLFARSEHKWRNILMVGILMILLLLLFDGVLARMPRQVAQRYSWDYIAEKGATGRTRIWSFLLAHYGADPLLRMIFGHGYGTCPVVNTMNGLVAHNLYLDNLITLGLLGMLLQFAIQGSFLWILRRRKNDPLLGAYWGMIGMCLSLSLVNYKPIWNIMLLALAMDGQKNENAGVAHCGDRVCTK